MPNCPGILRILGLAYLPSKLVPLRPATPIGSLGEPAAYEDGRYQGYGNEPKPEDLTEGIEFVDVEAHALTVPLKTQPGVPR